RRLETVPVLGPAPRRSALRKNRRLTGAARKLESRKAKVEGRREVRGQKCYCGSPMRRTSSAKHGLERRPSRCAVVLKVNCKKASQSDCDQVFGYGDENVFCV